jgi:ABC-2 type transport system permease protein
MRKALKLARREYKAAVHTKGFLIGLLIAPIFMGGSFLAMVLLKDRVDTTDRTVAIVDRSGIVAEALAEAAEKRNAGDIYDEDTGKKNKPAYLIEIVEPDEKDPDGQRLRLSDRVRSRDLHAFIEVGPGVLHPRDDPEAATISYYAKNAAMHDLRQWAGWPINEHLRMLRMAEAGIEGSRVGDLFDFVPVEGLGLVSVDDETGEIRQAARSSEAEALGVPFAMVMLMFIMMLIAAIPQLSAVMEEKTHRIAEVLLGSVTPSELMAGKILGSLAVSLTASAVYVIIGVLALGRMGMAERIPYYILPWFFVYMVTAMVMLGSTMVGLGSACNDAKEAQSITPVAMLPIIVPMFVMVPIVQYPNSTFATWLSLLPPFTPMVMLLRQASQAGIPGWQPVVGVAGMLAYTALAVWAAGRIFRVAILMQGQPLKLGKVVRWALRG